MTLLTGLALTLVSLAPQGDGSESLTVLRATDVRSLNNKVKDWFDVWLERDTATDTAARRRVQNRFQQAKDAFTRDWEAKQRKAGVEDLLKYVDDLQLIFENAFPYSRQSTSGTVKRIKPRTPEGTPANLVKPEYDIVAPRNYREREAYRTVVLVPGYVDGAWAEGEDYFEATWEDSELAKDTLFLVPDLDDSMDLDPAPDWNQANAFEQEFARNAALYLPLADLQENFRMDRSRMILDCGREASAWGLRFVSYSPHRFAGLILRDPVDPGDLRLESLTGMPVLLLRSGDADNRAACEKIAAALNAMEDGACTVLDVTGDYPYATAQADIGTWAAGVQRDLFRSKVVLAPNSETWGNEGYWVKILNPEPVQMLAPENKPKVVVTADREANRIEIEAISVAGVSLSLNDALVDLDREFTVVINGKANTQKRSRSLNLMAEGLFDRFDPTWIFTARIEASVPEGDR